MYSALTSRVESGLVGGARDERASSGHRVVPAAPAVPHGVTENTTYMYTHDHTPGTEPTLGIVELCAKILQIVRNDFKDYARTFCQLCAPFSIQISINQERK